MTQSHWQHAIIQFRPAFSRTVRTEDRKLRKASVGEIRGPANTARIARMHMLQIDLLVIACQALTSNRGGILQISRICSTSPYRTSISTQCPLLMSSSHSKPEIAETVAVVTSTQTRIFMMPDMLSVARFLALSLESLEISTPRRSTGTIHLHRIVC